MYPRSFDSWGMLVEADDEWQVRRRYFSKESMRQLYEPDFTDIAEPTPLRLAPGTLDDGLTRREKHSEFTPLDKTLSKAKSN